MKKITILGSTGSIGTQTLDIVAANRDKLSIFGLACGSSVSLLENQIFEFQPKVVCIGDESKKKILAVKFPQLKILTGDEGLVDLTAAAEADLVVNALSGSSGLMPALSAINAKKNIALANKESMVIAGEVLTSEARKRGVKIIPIDSEMSAIFQILNTLSFRGRTADVEKIILTSSGGPFFGKTKDELKKVTVEDALKHPTWKMGKKVTVDSATLMNKALEIIEACWFFDAPSLKIEVVIHRESLVHSMVQFRDGNILAQMSPTDMRFAIHYALFYPERVPNKLPRLDFSNRILSFQKPDFSLFKGPKLAYDALTFGGNAPALLNFANETAVKKFLNREIGFLEIYDVIQSIIQSQPRKAKPEISDLISLCV